MPWKESSVMDERLRFVARLLDGEPMSNMCREFGISRKTGYKIFQRYKDHGLEALTDRSRRPVRYANQLPSADRGRDRPPEAAQTALGRTQNPRKTPALASQRGQNSRRQHGSCGSRPPRTWSSEWPTRQPPRHRNGSLGRRRAKRSLVRRLQRRIPFGQWQVLLPAYRHRPCVAISSDVRSA